MKKSQERPFPISHFPTLRERARTPARDDVKGLAHIPYAGSAGERATRAITKNAARSAPIKAHTARRTAHSYSTNVTEIFFYIFRERSRVVARDDVTGLVYLPHAGNAGERAKRAITINAAGRHRLKPLPVTCYPSAAISTNEVLSRSRIFTLPYPHTSAKDVKKKFVAARRHLISSLMPHPSFLSKKCRKCRHFFTWSLFVHARDYTMTVKAERKEALGLSTLFLEIVIKKFYYFMSNLLLTNR